MFIEGRPNPKSLSNWEEQLMRLLSLQCVFHMQIENLKDIYEVVRTEKVSWHCVQKRKNAEITGRKSALTWEDS